MAGDKALLHAANQGDATSMQGLLQKELKCSQSGHEALLLACSPAMLIVLIYCLLPG